MCDITTTPLLMDNNEQNLHARILTSVNVTDGCQTKDPCRGFICPDPMICVDLWRMASCQCPPGFKKSDDAADRSTCVDINECEEDPGVCRNGGTCQNFVKTDKSDRSARFVCTCVPGYVGTTCNAAMKEQWLGITDGAIITMVVCAAILIRGFGEPVGDLGALLQQRLNEADNDPMAPPYDELRLYAYEGGGDTPVDLSEIEDNEDDDINFDYLHSWGPRFEKLAKLYAESPNDEEHL
ncbi:hypothetical protein BV898_14739 [Hypsibius exemplaris]|uniref:EGF-like domain-containing protein n=1 Tax=Hypsibius exemplaris TaxID=2072580 RepID=A0A9X6NIY1_HYPEX|nr:hypothetical protein BV898_14739 [Hypsibius exemplaris]